MTTLANVFAHPLLSPASVELVMFLLALATLVSPRIPQSRSTKRDGFAFLANPQVQALVAVHATDNIHWRTKINRMHLFIEAPSLDDYIATDKEARRLAADWKKKTRAF